MLLLVDVVELLSLAVLLLQSMVVLQVGALKLVEHTQEAMLVDEHLEVEEVEAADVLSMMSLHL